MEIIRYAGAAILCAASMMATAAGTEAVKYVVNPEKTYQTVDGFGASDAWSMRFIGEMPEHIQNSAADLLFSRRTDRSGAPEGIGLNIWRFNIGAGSLEQGDSSYINEGTRTDCFLLPDGTYDWNKQHGQVEFMKKAKERGVRSFLGFLNSPPVYYTKNGLATNTGRDGTYNLKESRYSDFARFMAEVTDGLYRHHGIRLEYIDPVNEPDGHWNWQGPKQEGTPATKYEIARLVRMLDEQLTQRDLDTKIIIPESSDYRCMFATHMTGPERGYLIQSFFCPDSTETYVGNLSHVPNLIAGHSYWTNTPVEEMKSYRKELNDTLAKYGPDFWQSEVCIMGNDEEIGGGHGYDRTMKTALYVARMIHHDMVYANSRSWQWWRAVGGNYKDGLLHQYRNEAGNDTIVDSKLLWAMGNYSRFIHPGARRIEIGRPAGEGILSDSATDPRGVMLSAYLNPDGTMAVVAINYSDKTEYIDLSVVGHIGEAMPQMTLYRTSDSGESLKPYRIEGNPFELAPRSVSTLVWNEAIPLDAIVLSDPCVLADEDTGVYYMTGTGGKMWKSRDLRTWAGPYTVAYPDSTSWMGPHPAIWAAELHKYNGKYYYFATFTNSENIIGEYRGNKLERRASHVFVSDRPDGPYVPMSDPTYLPADYLTLDGTFWVDRDRKPYMVYCGEWLQNWNGTIEKIELKKDLSGSVGKGKVLFRASASPWSRERIGGKLQYNRVTDGPWLFRTGTGRLGMLWTSWVLGDYTQGVAYSRSGTLNGPWIQEKDPVTPPNFGHGMIFTTFDGQNLLSAHSHKEVNGRYIRVPSFFKVDLSGDKLQVLGLYNQ